MKKWVTFIHWSIYGMYLNTLEKVVVFSFFRE